MGAPSLVGSPGFPARARRAGPRWKCTASAAGSHAKAPRRDSGSPVAKISTRPVGDQRVEGLRANQGAVKPRALRASRRIEVLSAGAPSLPTRTTRLSMRRPKP